MTTTDDDDDERVQKSSNHSHSRAWVNASDASACLWSVGDASSRVFNRKVPFTVCFGFFLECQGDSLAGVLASFLWQSKRKKKKNYRGKNRHHAPLPASASLCSDTLTFDGSGCLGQGEARRNPWITHARDQRLTCYIVHLGTHACTYTRTHRHARLHVLIVTHARLHVHID